MLETHENREILPDGIIEYNFNSFIILSVVTLQIKKILSKNLKLLGGIINETTDC